MKSLLYFLVSIVCLMSCGGKQQQYNRSNLGPREISYEVMATFPHDTASYTEGLLIDHGQLYESTGGQPRLDTFKSWFGPVDLKTGKAIKKIMLDTAYFGEGISILKGQIYQITYTTSIGFVYDASTLKKIKEFNYNGQGWSLTNDGTNLIMSNGGSLLQYLDPTSLKVVRTLNVNDNGDPVGNINELEFVNGDLYANQYLSNYVLKIDLTSGQVVGKADLSGLVTEVKKIYPNSQELNGIAYDSETQKIYITGKAWPTLYQIKFK